MSACCLAGGIAVMSAAVSDRPSERPALRRDGRTAQLTAAAIRTISSLPVAFEPNEGQTDPSVRYLGRGPGAGYFFQDAGVTLVSSVSSGASRSPKKGSGKPAPRKVAPALSERTFSSRLEFVGASSSPPTAAGELPGRVNYLRPESERSPANLPTYRSVVYSGLYPGIDLSYEGDRRGLKGTYLVAAGAEPATIGWKYSGARKTWVDRNGDLKVRLHGPEPAGIVERRPSAWQNTGESRIPVDVAFRVGKDGVAGFTVGPYDKTRPLVIDPLLEYSTFLGGNGTSPGAATGPGSFRFWGEGGHGVAVDAEGSAYITGITHSSDFPTTAGSYRRDNEGSADAFITKLSADGSALVFSTYLGTESEDVGRAIEVQNGKAHVLGWTASPHFPTTPGAYIQDRNAPACTWSRPSPDILCGSFLARLSADGSSLEYATYVQGSLGIDQEIGNSNDIAVSPNGDFLLTGGATEITTRSALQAQGGGGPNSVAYDDAFVTRVRPGGNGAGDLVYSTYLGGRGGDRGEGVAVDEAGNALVTGSTHSSNFPVKNAARGNWAGEDDAFLSKLSADGSALIYSTYLGGPNNDLGYSVAAGRDGSAFISGVAQEGFFTSASAFQPSFAGGESARRGRSPLDPPVQYYGDAFAAKFGPDGSVAYSTLLGGRNGDFSFGIAVDASGSAYVGGRTESSNFPTKDPLQPANSGGSDHPWDAYIAVLDPTGSRLTFSTYLGGSVDDGINAVAVDSLGNGYVTGTTSSPNFPTTNGAYQRVHRAVTPPPFNLNAFVAKICSVCSPLVQIQGASVHEGNEGVTPLTFRLNLSAKAPPVLRWETEDGTALAGSDYVRSGGPVVALAGRSFSADVPVTGDTTHEPDETFSIRVTDAASGTVLAQAAMGILNDDEQPEAPVFPTPSPAPEAVRDSGDGTGSTAETRPVAGAPPIGPAAGQGPLAGSGPPGSPPPAPPAGSSSPQVLPGGVSAPVSSASTSQAPTPVGAGGFVAPAAEPVPLAHPLAGVQTERDPEAAPDYGRMNMVSIDHENILSLSFAGMGAVLLVCLLAAGTPGRRRPPAWALGANTPRRL